VSGVPPRYEPLTHTAEAGAYGAPIPEQWSPILCVIGSRLLARWKCVMRDGASAAGPDSSD